MKVLVVEDNPVVALDYEWELEECGHAVLGPVATVRRAVKLIEETPPDGAILDYHLKGETSARLLEMLGRAGTPFVVVTGAPTDLEDTQYADRVIVKPCSPDDVIRKLLDQTDG
jgi:DNA-binding response OmpR family regulator